MISRNGSGDVGPVALYTSALAGGAYTPLVRLVSAVDPDTIVDLKINGHQVQRSGNNNAPVLAPVYVQPGDVFTYTVQNSASSAWSFEFALYAEGDVSYEEP